MGETILRHGSDHIIEKPDLYKGHPHNDYGRGFYCTEDLHMAGEWACKQNTDGFINNYNFSDDGLNVLDLSDGSHTVLEWIAVLLKYRTFHWNSEIAIDTRNYMIEHFAIDTVQYDVIKGYRADDSYFQYAEAFVENTLPLRSLDRALRLGKLGTQTALVSEKVFSRLAFLDAVPAERTVYYPQFAERDSNARDTYRKEIRKAGAYRSDIFALDILREELTNDDPRIQRSLSR